MTPPRMTPPRMTTPRELTTTPGRRAARRPARRPALRAATTAAAAAILAGALGACTGDDAGLLDTSSALFPVHTMREHHIEDQKALFRLRLVDHAPLTETVQEAAEVRLGPGETFEVVDLLMPGTEVVTDAQVGHWVRIADDGGYVSATTLRGEPWQTTVAGPGTDGDVDECPAALVDFTRISAALGRPYYAIHSFCGGEPVLHLGLGDTVVIDGVTWTVVDVGTFPLAGNAVDVEQLAGEALLHTCDIVHGHSVVVGITR